MLAILIYSIHRIYEYKKIEIIKINFFFWISVELYSLFFIGLIILLANPSNNYLFSSVVLLVGLLIWYYAFTRIYQEGKEHILYKLKIIDKKKITEKKVYFHKVILTSNGSKFVLYNPFISMDQFEKVKIRK